MVSPQNPVTSATAVDPTRGNRGFISEEVLVASGPGAALADLGTSSNRRSFWGSVIGGTLFTISLFVLSWFLMLGCHVGVARNGMLWPGSGAAIWMIITSCIAFYAGGLIANPSSRTADSGWLRGSMLWGLSIPLTLLLCGIVSGGAWTGIGPHWTVITNNSSAIDQAIYPAVPFGYIWTMFFILAAGLFFAIVGSSSMAPMRSRDRLSRNAATT